MGPVWQNITDLFSDPVTWLQENALLLAGGAALSLVVMAASLWAVRLFLIYIPPDFFARPHPPLARWKDTHPILRWVALIAKNAVGGLLILAGLMMILTPGQGVLSLLLGLSLTDIPGKRAIERRIIQRPAVLNLINSMRAKAGRPPLVFDGRDEG